MPSKFAQQHGLQHSSKPSPNFSEPNHGSAGVADNNVLGNVVEMDPKFRSNKISPSNLGNYQLEGPKPSNAALKASHRSASGNSFGRVPTDKAVSKRIATDALQGGTQESNKDLPSHALYEMDADSREQTIASMSDSQRSDLLKALTEGVSPSTMQSLMRRKRKTNIAPSLSPQQKDLAQSLLPPSSSHIANRDLLEQEFMPSSQTQRIEVCKEDIEKNLDSRLLAEVQDGRLPAPSKEDYAKLQYLSIKREQGISKDEVWFDLNGHRLNAPSQSFNCNTLQDIVLLCLSSSIPHRQIGLRALAGVLNSIVESACEIANSDHGPDQQSCDPSNPECVEWLLKIVGFGGVQAIQRALTSKHTSLKTSGVRVMCLLVRCSHVLSHISIGDDGRRNAYRSNPLLSRRLPLSFKEEGQHTDAADKTDGPLRAWLLEWLLYPRVTICPVFFDHSLVQTSDNGDSHAFRDNVHSREPLSNILQSGAIMILMDQVCNGDLFVENGKCLKSDKMDDALQPLIDAFEILAKFSLLHVNAAAAIARRLVDMINAVKESLSAQPGGNAFNSLVLMCACVLCSQDVGPALEYTGLFAMCAGALASNKDAHPYVCILWITSLQRGHCPSILLPFFSSGGWEQATAQCTSASEISCHASLVRSMLAHAAAPCSTIRMGDVCNAAHDALVSPVMNGALISEHVTDPGAVLYLAMLIESVIHCREWIRAQEPYQESVTPSPCLPIANAWVIKAADVCLEHMSNLANIVNVEQNRHTSNPSALISDTTSFDSMIKMFAVSLVPEFLQGMSVQSPNIASSISQNTLDGFRQYVLDAWVQWTRSGGHQLATPGQEQIQVVGHNPPLTARLLTACLAKWARWNGCKFPEKGMACFPIQVTASIGLCISPEQVLDCLLSVHVQAEFEEILSKFGVSVLSAGGGSREKIFERIHRFLVGQIEYLRPGGDGNGCCLVHDGKVWGRAGSTANTFCAPWMPFQYGFGDGWDQMLCCMLGTAVCASAGWELRTSQEVVSTLLRVPLTNQHERVAMSLLHSHIKNSRISPSDVEKEWFTINDVRKLLVHLSESDDFVLGLATLIIAWLVCPGQGWQQDIAVEAWNSATNGVGTQLAPLEDDGNFIIDLLLPVESCAQSNLNTTGSGTNRYYDLIQSQRDSSQLIELQQFDFNAILQFISCTKTRERSCVLWDMAVITMAAILRSQPSTETAARALESCQLASKEFGDVMTSLWSTIKES